MAERMKILAMRLDKESIEYVNKISSLVKSDKSTIMRQILQRGIEEDRKERALEMYSKGKLSLEGAARFAGIYIGEFLDLMRERGIESNVTLEMFMKSWKNMAKLKA